jgi:hypothetical protein
MFRPGGNDGFFPLVQAEGAAAQPGQRHQPDALVVVQPADRAQQLLAHRIPHLVEQHIGLTVIDGVGADIGIGIALLHVIFARLQDDEAHLVQRQIQRRFRNGMARRTGGRQERTHGNSCAFLFCENA